MSPSEHESNRTRQNLIVWRLLLRLLFLDPTVNWGMANTAVTPGLSGLEFISLE